MHPQPANATLGFGAVLAVSRAASPRRHHLLFAANLTGIDITIPDQPVWSDRQVAAFRAHNSTITRGSALAWMGHLNALQWYPFLRSGLETAIILEDDVDWDIHLRTRQVPLVSENLQALLASNSTYWSDLDRWEILYLGHCGDFFNSDKFDRTAHRIFADDTMLPHDRLHGATPEFLSSLGLQDGERVIHRSQWPLCTFGYAVTRASAHRIVTDFAAREPEGGCQAFDVRLLEACRDQEWQCYTANPELFHHVMAPSEIAEVNEGITPGKAAKKLADTPNIACSARSDSFYTENAATLAYLQVEVGLKGHCLIDAMGKDAE
ncbi:glycosyltransferase family 25 protein [Aplosporella prunicola CBS 121167]|uniref:Glycosyltransferase family 25 protein n=1 Tax=Aplosporella prunicola CBS 121167 TaxID=1176127 RepID=A0A6A6BCV6_9PEZI|nr:glycosyltransferase family 25 protein [Aplosporella prunicola CBS 121167]KAF2140321.1 glycosyltransferase family 25 protein [Aplosporella prunicola CBS 121167]